MSGSLPADFAPTAAMLSLIGTCVLRLTDVVVITEAEPLDLPGPRIVFVNEAFEAQTGFTREEVIGRTPRILQGPLTDQAILRRMGAAFRRWEPVRVELVNYTKTREPFNVEMDIVPIADERGWYTHWVSIQRDVTERKRAEAEDARRELQRTESIGTLAIGIAHDFNNIIAAITGNVMLARQHVEDGSNPRDALDQLDHAATRARNLVQQILAYGRRQPQAFARLALPDAINDSVFLMRAALPAGVAINVELGSLELDVFADAGQLNQVLLNLGTNAWHAMQGDCGTIDIRLTAVPDAAHGDVAAAQHALLEIQDSGQGMDEATLARIFEPYFTTKPIGQGTGLGLSVVWGIVKAHGGTIEVRSEVGRGTTFSLLLPVLERDAAAAGVPAAVVERTSPPRCIGAGRHVLVVDDDEVVLLMLEGILTHAAYRVSAFTDPLLALDAVRAGATRFDIVVSDLNMPAMSGLQLAQALALTRPELPVVLCSGYVSDTLTRDALQAGTVAVFRKEDAVEQLTQLLADVLARAEQAALA